MFQFNFNVKAKEDDQESMGSVSETVCPQKRWLPSQSHKITSTHLQALSEENTVEEVTIGQTAVKYLSMTSAIERLKKTETSANITPVFTDNTDLVPAVYEGGLKIWECSWDLVNYMASSDIDLERCRVLELGCGAGLPGIYAIQHGAHVTLQDYNEEVINYITIPNVVLNAVDLSVLEDGNPANFKETIEDVMSKSCFYSGDWEELDKIFTDGTSHATVNSVNKVGLSKKHEKSLESTHKFDLILTSETIYNPECHEKLLTLMTNHLKQNGKILLAAKSYYFGVGGGILQFCDLVKRRGQLDVKTVFTNEIGVKREILELTLKSS